MFVDFARRRRAGLLRRRGQSYSSIAVKLSLAKSTLSSWFADKAWSKMIKEKNDRERLKTISKSLVMANRVRKEINRRKRRQYGEEAQLEYGQLVKDPLFVLGLGIYWGEGDKTENGRVAVINTDGDLLKVVVKFYCRCLKVLSSKLRVGLFVYEGMDQEKEMVFWSEKLSVPRSQFIKVQVLKSRSRRTERKSRHGVCSIYFSSTELSVKIREWIRLSAGIV